jgi:hypothetical protein
MRSLFMSAVLLVGLGPGKTAAQQTITPRPSIREEATRYRAETLREVNAVLGDFVAAWARDDGALVAALFDREGRFRLTGKEEVTLERASMPDSLPAILARLGPLVLSLQDAAVGSDLVYLSGQYRLEAASPETAESNGEYLFIMRLNRNHWSVRSFFLIESPVARIAS